MLGRSEHGRQGSLLTHSAVVVHPTIRPCRISLLFPDTCRAPKRVEIDPDAPADNPPTCDAPRCEVAVSSDLSSCLLGDEQGGVEEDEGRHADAEGSREPSQSPAAVTRQSLGRRGAPGCASAVLLSSGEPVTLPTAANPGRGGRTKRGSRIEPLDEWPATRGDGDALTRPRKKGAVPSCQRAAS
jgi:hypothetical protein